MHITSLSRLQNALLFSQDEQKAESSQPVAAQSRSSALILPKKNYSKLFRVTLVASMVIQLLTVPYSFNGILATGGDHDDEDACELVITKVGNPQEVAPGGQIVYEVKVKNIGEENCTGEGVGLVETYDGKTSFVTSSPSPTQDNNFWNLDTIEPGEEQVVSITVDVSESVEDGDILTNKACVWAYQQGDKSDEGAWKCATAQTTVKEPAGNACNLEISKIGSPDPVTPGGSISYTVNIKNTGTDVCTGGGVELKEYYDTRTVYVASSPLPTSGEDYWNFGNVFPGDEKNVTIQVKVSEAVDDGDILTNKACVWAFQQGAKDDAGSWKCATSTTTVREPQAPGCKLVVDKTDSPDPVTPGSNLSYTIKVRNAGDDMCTGGGVLLKEFYDQMTAFQSSSPVPSEGNNLWVMGTLFPGDERAVAVQMGVSAEAQDGTVLRNKACTWAFQNGPKEDLNNWVCDEEDTTVRKLHPNTPVLTLTKKVTDNNETLVKSNTAQRDEVLTYTIEIKNDGNAGATDVVLTDDYDESSVIITDNAQADTDNGLALGFPIGVINPGQTVKKEIKVKVKGTVPNDHSFLNKATALASNHAPVDDTVTTLVKVLPPGEGIDVSLVKTASPSTVVVGDQTAFTITVTNGGPQNATGVSVKDLLSPVFLYASDDGSGAYNSTTGIWTVGNLDIGQSRVLHITVTANSSGTFENMAEVTAHDQIDIDSTPNNNISTEDDQSAATVTVKEKGGPPGGCASNCGGGGGGRSNYPRIGIKKEVGKQVVSRGDTVAYTLTITAGGDDESVNVTVSDTLPQGLSYADGSASPRMWTLGNMAYGTTRTVTYDVKVNQDAVVGAYENVAVVTISNGIPPDNRAEARARVEIPGGGGGGGGGSTPTPLLSINKVASVAFTNPDSEFSYTVTVQNIGTGKAINVSVDDVLPGGITFVEGGAETKIFRLGDMAPGETKQVYYTVKVAHDTAAGTYANYATARADNAPADSDSAEVEVRQVKVHKFTELPNTGVEDGIAVGAGILAASLIGMGLIILAKKREEETEGI